MGGKFISPEQRLIDFKRRLKRIGISIEIGTNFPMVYLEKINGRKVKERFYSDYKWCFAMLPKKDHHQIRFIDNFETFDLIRSYAKKDILKNFFKKMVS